MHVLKKYKNIYVDAVMKTAMRVHGDEKLIIKFIWLYFLWALQVRDVKLPEILGIADFKIPHAFIILN